LHVVKSLTPIRFFSKLSVVTARFCTKFEVFKAKLMEVQISLARTPYSLVKKTGIFGLILLKIQPTFSSQYSGLILTL